MRLSYMISYACKSTLHKHDRVFSLLNISSVAVTMMILVALTGLLKSFKDYSENILRQFPLRIEIFKAENVLYNDLQEIEKDICALKGVSGCYKRVPTAIRFLKADGVERPYPPRGCTILPQESLQIKDVRGEDVRFLNRDKIDSRFDEVGIIASFDFLKTLAYFPDSALPNKPETWEGSEVPKVLHVILKESKEQSPKETVLPVPLVGVVDNLRDAYIITEDFFNIIGSWRDEFRYILTDRHGQKLMEPEVKITGAHYVLTDEEQIDWVYENWGSGKTLAILPERTRLQETAVWLEDHPEIEQQRLLKIYVFHQSWETETSYEDRLVISPVTQQTLTPQQIELVKRKLREFPPLQKLDDIREHKEGAVVQTWADFPEITGKHQYIQAAVYAKDREDIMPLLEKLSEMGVVPSTPLKDYLKTFDRQEKFFKNAAMAIFVLILFLAAIVLFSTFYASVQRKRKQIGILKACGAPGPLIRKLYYMESAIVIAVGMAIGIYGGLKIGNFMTNWISNFVKLSEKELIFSLPGLDITGFFALDIARITAVVAAFCWLAIYIPAQIASNTDPAQVVRN